MKVTKNETFMPYFESIYNKYAVTFICDGFETFVMDNYIYGNKIKLISPRIKEESKCIVQLIDKKDISKIINLELPSLESELYKTTIIPATCTEKGLATYQCLIDTIKIEFTLSLDILEHSYGEWIITKEATYKEEGHKYHICELCLKEEGELIPLLDSQAIANELIENIKEANISLLPYTDLKTYYQKAQELRDEECAMVMEELEKSIAIYNELVKEINNEYDTTKELFKALFKISSAMLTLGIVSFVVRRKYL